MKKLAHLSEIYDRYDTYIVDLWGVVQDGINLNQSAMEEMDKLYSKNKKIFFLSNAPRPSSNVVKFLSKLQMDKKYLENIYTSGQAAINSFKENKFGKLFFHLGPDRDKEIFEGLEKNKTSIEKSDFILCTGLFDEKENDLEYYKNILKNFKDKKFICTNPDLTVHRGKIIEYCAGTVAKIFETLGGEVVYFGKPYPGVYNELIDKGKKVLAIGDNLKTDIKGANNLKIDSLFITGGVHRSEYKNERDIEKILEKYGVSTNFFQNNLIW